MPDETVTDKLDGLVDVLDHLLSEIRRIANTLEYVEDALGPGLLLGDDDRYIRVKIIGTPDDALMVELLPVEDE